MTETKEETLTQGDWERKLEEKVEEGYVVVRTVMDLKIATLEKDGDYWEFTEDAKLRVMPEAKAKMIRDSVEKKEAAEETKLVPVQKAEIVEESMFNIEEFTGIPRQFMIMMGEKGREDVYVKRAGLLFKAEKKGMRALQVEIQPIEKGGYFATAKLYPEITKKEVELVQAAQGLDPGVQATLLGNLLLPYIEHGTAVEANVKMKTMHPYMRELASTRASNRVLRAFVACGFTSVEELSDYRGDSEGSED